MFDELAFVVALESPAAVCGRETNAASPNIQTLPNAILGTDKSYIVCIKGSLVCTTSCPKTLGRTLSAILFCCCTKSSLTIPCGTENFLCVPYLSVNND